MAKRFGGEVWTPFQYLFVTVGVALAVVYSATSAGAQSVDLRAAYRFDEGSGATVKDASGNNNAGTITGASWGVGRFGRALVFDGDDSVTIPNSTSLNIGGRGLTIELWVNVTDTGRDYAILSKPWTAGSMVSPYYQYGVEFDGNGTKQVVRHRRGCGG